MPRAAWCFVAAVAVLSTGHIAAAEPRSGTARATFQRANPCPATGKTIGACPGYVVDHVKPLCSGGADHPNNMQWQTVAEAKIKNRAERAQCRTRPTS